MAVLGQERTLYQYGVKASRHSMKRKRRRKWNKRKKKSSEYVPEGIRTNCKKYRTYWSRSLNITFAKIPSQTRTVLEFTLIRYIYLYPLVLKKLAAPRRSHLGLTMIFTFRTSLIYGNFTSKADTVKSA